MLTTIRFHGTESTSTIILPLSERLTSLFFSVVLAVVTLFSTDIFSVVLSVLLLLSLSEMLSAEEEPTSDEDAAFTFSAFFLFLMSVTAVIEARITIKETRTAIIIFSLFFFFFLFILKPPLHKFITKYGTINI